MLACLWIGDVKGLTSLDNKDFVTRFVLTMHSYYPAVQVLNQMCFELIAAVTLTVHDDIIFPKTLLGHAFAREFFGDRRR